MKSRIEAVLFDAQAPLWDASLSSMWAIKNFPGLSDFFLASQRLGFARIELNHQVTSNMLAGINWNGYKVSSIHEPCPADVSTDLLKARDWLISATDEECRRQGVASIKRSIDLAKELGARMVVVHAGNIRDDGGNDHLRMLEKELRALYDAGQATSEAFQQIKESLIKSRSALVGSRLEAVKKSLEELIEYAGRYDGGKGGQRPPDHERIRLGLENRYYYLDIPSPDEMEVLLNLAGPEQLGFVFDVGHAQAMDRLGFFPNTEWLTRYTSRMIGVHLHDVVGITDHYAPGFGEVDFDWVAACLPKDTLRMYPFVRTCELRESVTPKQIIAGMKFLVEKGCVTAGKVHRYP